MLAIHALKLLVAFIWVAFIKCCLKKYHSEVLDLILQSINQNGPSASPVAGHLLCATEIPSFKWLLFLVSPLWLSDTFVSGREITSFRFYNYFNFNHL